MGVKSRGRGAAATFGLLLVLASVAGAVVLWLMAEQRPEQAIERFARGPVGCTTTLEFGDTGTFYVYEEVVGEGTDAFDDCEPVTTPDAEFGFQLLDDGEPVTTRDDTSITYDTSVAIGESVARIEIAAAGRYELVVEGSDADTVAAVGRDPDQGVTDLRRGAIVVAVLGVLLGALLLILAGRRSKRAATFTTPAGPGWAPAAPPDAAAQAAPPVASQAVSPDGAPSWPPEPPRIPDIAARLVEPTAPAATPPDETMAPPASPWAPPRASERQDPPPPS